MAPRLFLDLPTLVLGDGSVKEHGNLHERSFHKLWAKDHKLQHVLQQCKHALVKIVELMPTDGPSLAKDHKVAMRIHPYQIGTSEERLRMWHEGMLLNLLSAAEDIWEGEKCLVHMLQERVQVAMQLVMEEQNLWAVGQEERRVFRSCAEFCGVQVWHPEDYWKQGNAEKYWAGARSLFDNMHAMPIEEMDHLRNDYSKLGEAADAADREVMAGGKYGELSTPELLASELIAPPSKRPSAKLGRGTSQTYYSRLDPHIERSGESFSEHLRRRKPEMGGANQAVLNEGRRNMLTSDRELADLKLRSKFGHKIAPPDALDLDFLRNVRRGAERHCAQLISETDVLKKEFIEREVDFAPKRAEMLHRIYELDTRFQLLSKGEAEKLRFELSLLHKQRKLLDLMNSVCDEMRALRIDYYARMELTQKEAELHYMLEEKLSGTKAPSSGPGGLTAQPFRQAVITAEARVAAHEALRNAFRVDIEDKADYADRSLAKARKWSYSSDEATFRETLRKLHEMQRIDVLRLLEQPLPHGDQARTHAELDLLNYALVQMETDVPASAIAVEGGRLSFLHELVRKRVKLLRDVAIDADYSAKEVEEAKDSIRKALELHQLHH
ncbi:unnamed protein product [Amoebophrya sp. A25]|nr:unnamed protein product [Amoebophrya sp. A25]|eukprot:GSA25T00015194001.1